MAFQLQAGQELEINGVSYHVVEHPSAPGLPYGQEGRQAVVYQLADGQALRALKVFRARYQVPALVALADRLTDFARLSGLSVCQRTVLTPRRYPTLLRQYPDLLYSVLMPWVAGPTWTEVLLTKDDLLPEQSLSLAQTLAALLAELEQQGVAHCDLSGANVLLPLLAAPVPAAPGSIELVDVEQLYGPGLDRPAVLPAGSPGYAHRAASQGLWQPEADRFAGGVLLAEMLGWCDGRVRAAAWGEGYFDPVEMQQDGARYQILRTVLYERWGAPLARLFEHIWASDTLADCPTFGTWWVTLPDAVPASRVHAPPLTPREDLRLAGHPPSVRTPSTHPSMTQAVAPPVAVRAESPFLDRLFDDGLAAYRQGQWTTARELLADVVRQVPTYERGGQRAAALLAAADRRATRGQLPQRRPLWIGVPIVLLVLFLLAGTTIVLQTQSPGWAQETRTAAVQETARTQAAATAPAIQGAVTLQTQTARERREGTATALAVQQAVATARADVTATSQAVQSLLTMQAGAEAVAAKQTADARTQDNATVQAQATGAAQVNATLEAVAVAQVQETARTQIVAATQAQTMATVKAQEVSANQSATAKARAAEAATAAANRATDQMRTATAQARSTSQAEAAAQATAQAVVAQTTAGAAAQATYQAQVAIPATAQAAAAAQATGQAQLAAQATAQAQAAAQETAQAIQEVAVRAAVQATADAAARETATAQAKAGRGTIAGDTINRVGLIRGMPGNGGRITYLGFTADTGKVIVGSDGGIVQYRQVTDGAVVQSARTSGVQAVEVAVAPNEQIFASADVDKTVGVWNTANGALRRFLEGHGDIVFSLAFSPDSQLLASGSTDRTIRIWRAADGAPVDRFTGLPDRVRTVAFSPDGQLLASGTDDHSVELWQLADHQLARRLTGHAGRINEVVFAPGGQLLGSAAEDGVIKIWRVADGALVRNLGPPDRVFALAFSPDGQLVAGGTEAGHVRIWRLSDGALIRSLTEHGNSPVNSVAFSRDGSLLASGSWDGNVIVWGVR